MNDLRYIKNPNQWVNLLCPLKRHVTEKGFNRLQTAYLVDERPILHYGNIFRPSPNDPTETFESHEAIIAAGWKVD